MRFAVRVSDDSINKLVPAGAFVICKPWSEAETLSRGRYVYIEQTRGDLVERSVRIVEGDGPGSRLRTNSTVPALSIEQRHGRPEREDHWVGDRRLLRSLSIPTRAHGGSRCC